MLLDADDDVDDVLSRDVSVGGVLMAVGGDVASAAVDGVSGRGRFVGIGTSEATRSLSA